jgi:hypothetical protein
MRGLAIAFLFAACFLAGGAPAAAGPADWMFEPDHVTEVALDLPVASREALDADPGEYVSATFRLTRSDGTSYGPLTVGVKLKGHGSFRTLEGKAGFKLKFNEFVGGQTFLGLKKLTLNNMVQDATMLHELLAYEAFRAAGLPGGWRTGYSFVRVNGADYGVYLNLETPDSVSLPRWYPTTRHLFEAERGSDIGPGAAGLFERDEGNSDLSDLEALFAAVESWQDVDAAADLDQLTRFWAVEKYIGHWDGYSGRPLPNNYYLHSDAGGRFTMLPWGTDQTWQRRLAYGDPGGRMFNRCLADPPCADRYRAAVADVRATLGAHDLDLLASDTAALLYPWQRMDPRRERSLHDMRTEIVALHDFLAVRPADAIWLTPAAPTSGETDDHPGADPGPTGETDDHPGTDPGPSAAADVPAASAAESADQAKLELAVTPKGVRRATRKRFTFRVTADGRAVPRARISFGGRKLRTDGRGRAAVLLRLHTPRVLRARAAATGFADATARVRVLRR